MARNLGKGLGMGILPATTQSHPSHLCRYVLAAYILALPGILPGKAADGPGLAAISQHAPSPEFSLQRGSFDKSFTLSLKVALEGASIRYTTDGSEPLKTSGQVYISPLRITNTTVLRATSVKQGCLPSPVQTHSYIFLEQIINQPKNPPGFPVH